MNAEAPELVVATSGLINRRRLAKVISYSTVQLLVQALGFVAGLVLVRQMAQAEYGLYTLAVTMLSLGAVLFDLGLGTAVLALGGPHHASHAQLRGLLGDAFRLQWQLAVLSGLPLTIGFAVMLLDQGLSPQAIFGFLLLILAAASLNARNALWLSVLRLRGDLRLQQRLDLSVNFGRTLLILALALVHVDSVLALLVLALASAASYVTLHRSLGKPAPKPSDGKGHFRNGLIGFVKRQAPNSLYYCFSGQIAVWQISVFGNAERVAEVGALGRLALLFTIVSAVLAALVQPYFARPRTSRELLQVFIGVNTLFAVVTLGCCLCAIWAPHAVLWVLGPKYSSLVAEAPWMVASACLAAWSAAVYSMGASRGWLVPSVFIIPAGLGSIALAAAWVDTATVRGAFQINTASTTVATVTVVTFVGHALWRHMTASPAASQSP